MLAFVAAEHREFDGLMGKAERVAKLGWPLQFACMAWIRGEPVVLIADGPGPKLAGRALEIAREYQNLNGIVSTGFCGALNPALQACDIFVPIEVLNVGQALSPAKMNRVHHTGKLLSIDRVVSTAAEKAELFKTGADAVEMEAGTLAAKAAEFNLPFYCVRVVSDTAAESFPLDFNQVRDREGRFSRAKILGAAMRKPSIFPALMNLNQRSKKAAQALGDFIADARF